MGAMEVLSELSFNKLDIPNLNILF